MPQKIVINKKYGGFSLSPEATLWLYKKGYTKHATPVNEWYTTDKEELEKDLVKWRKYLANPEKHKSIFLSVFSPDEKFILNERKIERNEPLLVQCVEELKERANGTFAKLKVVDVPDDIKWQIEEYDGMEWIAESHETWG